LKSGLRTAASVKKDLEFVRRETLELFEMIPETFLYNPPRSFMGPIIWDLIHIAKFEELWVLHNSGGFPMDDLYLSNDYNAVITPRKNRVKLVLPTFTDAKNYLSKVRDSVIDYLESVELESEDKLLKSGYVFDLAIQHECQHQETILQSLALYDSPPFRHPGIPNQNGVSLEEKMVEVIAGNFKIGSDSQNFVYDNELNSKNMFIEGFLIDSSPVTGGKYIEFIDAGGYDNHEYWSEEGWNWKSDENVTSPMYWEKVGGEWTIRRYHQTLPVSYAEPVIHVSYWEAEAYAKSVGKRLPTEFEWEKACRWDPNTGKTYSYPWGEDEPDQNNSNVGKQRWSPAPIGSYKDFVSPVGCHQMIGDVYEWTSSNFLPYEDFKAFPYDEYSEVHFGTEYKVLRGSSWATSPLVSRSTFRNWDYPQRRQIFSGFRCAKDLDK